MFLGRRQATNDSGERARDQHDQISEFAFSLGEIRKVSRNQCYPGCLVMDASMYTAVQFSSSSKSHRIKPRPKSNQTAGKCSKLNISGEMDVIGCSRTSRAALASFRRPQSATSAELGPLCRILGRQDGEQKCAARRRSMWSAAREATTHRCHRLTAQRPGSATDNGRN